MIYCVGIGLATGFIFLMCLLFVAGNLEDVITSPYGPLGAIFYNATGNKAGTVCLTIFPLVCLVFAAISIMTTSSRMTYGKSPAQSQCLHTLTQFISICPRRRPALL
jgi:choline transport protein